MKLDDVIILASIFGDRDLDYRTVVQRFKITVSNLYLSLFIFIFLHFLAWRSFVLSKERDKKRIDVSFDDGGDNYWILFFIEYL